MNSSRKALCLMLAAASVITYSATPAAASERIEAVEVTATRIPEAVNRVPADVSIVAGDELQLRNGRDLRTALGLVPGAEAPSGGDAGPASAVLSLWGLHEFDAFLLVVDGVPWGGAFNPTISTLNFVDVERIEVLKGSAPVMYGATSFVGVVQVVHYPAGKTSNEADISAGSFGSGRGAMSITLPSEGDFKQSLSIDARTLGFADKRETVRGLQALYRASDKLGAGSFELDADVSLNRDVPPSPVVRDGTGLASVTPHNANFNPADARIDETRYHLTLRYSRALGVWDWNTVISIAHSDTQDTRGFLRPDLIDNGTDNADSQRQRRSINDLYFDINFANDVVEDFSLVAGVDLLYGVGRQSSVNGAYYVPLDGNTLAPSTSDLHVDEINTIADRRFFAGQYLQFDWRSSSRFDIAAGIRVNETYEQKASAHVDGFDPAANQSDYRLGRTLRISGTIGASYQAWQDAGDEVVLYADYRNAFKPAAIDFGPDYTPNVLRPETAQSYEAGLKASLLDGNVHLQVELFQMDFRNLVVATTDSLGSPVLINAGGQRLQGAELEGRYALGNDFELAANLSYHSSRYTHFVFDDNGTTVDASGNTLPLAPKLLASAGLIYAKPREPNGAPPQGLHASFVLSYIGNRFLDQENMAQTPAYETLDATIGYGLGRFDLSVEGSNLTNRRPAVSQSEFGDSSFYLLPARTIFATLGVAL